jgi:hypothetical protein
MARTTATISFQALELKGSLLPASLLEEVSKLNRPKELLLVRIQGMTPTVQAMANVVAGQRLGQQIRG